MEYPGTRFRRHWRVAMLAVFVLAFFTITPLVILTTAGYRIDWGGRGLVFRGTGSISIDIKPNNASVYLNGIRLLGSMPYRLNALTPDNVYTLRVTSDGYYDWQKEIPVTANITYYLKDITMLKKTEAMNISTGTIPFVSISPNGQNLLFGKSEKNGTILYYLNTKTGEKTILSNIGNNQNLKFSWQQNSSHALIEIKKNNSTDWMLATVDEKRYSPISTYFNGQPQKVEWNKGSDPELYVSVSTTLYSFRPQSNSISKVGKIPTTAWHVDQGHVSILEYSTSTNSLILTNDYFGFPNTVSSIPLNELEYLGNFDWNISAHLNKNYLLTKADGQFVKIVTPRKIFTIPATNFFISDFNNWLVMWNETEIWTYVSGEEPKLLNRSGQKLIDVVPLDEYNTLALSFQKRTTALYPYYLISHDFLPGISSMSADPNNRVLYFSSRIKNTDGLWQISY